MKYEYSSDVLYLDYYYSITALQTSTNGTIRIAVPDPIPVLITCIGRRESKTVTTPLTSASVWIVTDLHLTYCSILRSKTRTDA